MAYIEKEPIVEFIKRGLNNTDKAKAFGYDAIEILTEIEYSPTADVVGVKHGEWIKNQYISQVLGIPVKKEFVFTCSLCGHDTIGKSKYCRECGAKMDGGNAE